MGTPHGTGTDYKRADARTAVPAPRRAHQIDAALAYPGYPILIAKLARSLAIRTAVFNTANSLSITDGNLVPVLSSRHPRSSPAALAAAALGKSINGLSHHTAAIVTKQI